MITQPQSKTGMNFAVLTISYLLRPYGNAFRIYLDQMKKGLCEPNRYEITVKIPEKAIKTRGKAGKQVRRANFVSKWYVIHKCSGLKRCRTENRRFSPVFFVFLAFPRFFKNRIFAKIKRCKTSFSTFHPEPDRWTTISGRFFESFSLGKPPFFRFFQKNLC